MSSAAMSVAGLVLAAGAGTRFGGPKALVRFDGEPLVARAVRMLTAAGCAPVVAVLGAGADEVRAAVDLPHVAVNPRWAQGLGSSLRCGLAALPVDVSAVVVALADQPLVGTESVTRLVGAWRDGAVAAVATYGGQPRNPVVLARSVWPALCAALTGDTGAGPWLRAHPELVTLVACDDTGSPHDIDTQDDLLALTDAEEKTMQLDHEFTVPVPADQAWAVLLDIERIAPCLPGAVIDTVTQDGFTGRVKVKVGPIGVSYAGSGHFLETDQGAGRVLIGASGKETRGSGTAKATIAAQLHDEGASTRVTVRTELNITGKPAQFGRGVMVDVGNKLLGQFTDCLAERLGGGSTDDPAADAAPVPGPASPADTAAPPTAETPRAQPPDPVPIDLLGTAGLPVLKRVAPVAGAVAILVLVIAVWRRRR